MGIFKRHEDSVRFKNLLDAAKQVLEDHDERIALYPQQENQPNRWRVMELLRRAIKEAE